MRIQQRVAVIGLDGATFDLIKPWIAAGKLPTFSRLLQQGSHAPLKSVVNMRSASAWTSFATGKNPGKHGIFDFWHRIPGSYGIRFINGTARSGKAFWDYVSDAGGKVTVINVPMTYPAKPLNGIMIAGMDAPGLDSAEFCYPETVIQELLQKNGGYVIEPGVTSLCIAGRFDEAAEATKESANLRYEAARHLMASYPWDLFVVVFRELDPIQHTFWKFMDASHPEHDPALAAKYGEVIFDVYRHVDGLVGQLLEGLDPTIPTFFLSDHGFGANQRGNELLPGWLEGIGMMRFSSAGGKKRFNAISAKLQPLVIHGLSFLFDQVHRRTSRRTKERLARWFPGLRERVQTHLSLGGIDWSQTRAFADGARENIWVNLKGREPEGIIEPGTEYEQLIAELREELLQARDGVTGALVVESVFRGREVYQGHRLEQAADIIVQWKDDVVISSIVSPHTDPGKATPGRRVCYVPGEESRYISGYHRPHGVFMAVGENVRRNQELPEADILDLAPTILHTMGLPIPDDMDGRVLTEVFVDPGATAATLSVAASDESMPEDTEDTYSAEDQEKITERLKGLGYL